MSAQKNTIPVGPLGPWLPSRSILLTITPQQARSILENYNGQNRRFRPMVSKLVCAALTSGHWQINGETIIFGFDPKTGTGVLLDGQNRLQGCILADLPLASWVMFGLDPATFTTIDRGSSRNLADDLSVRHEKSPSSLAAVTRLAFNFCNGTRGPTVIDEPVNAEDVFAFIDEHPDIRISNTFVSSHKAEIPIPGRVVGACHYLFGVKSPEARDEYFSRLISGADMEPGDPILTCRNRLFQDRIMIAGTLKGNAKLIAFSSMYILITTWNHFRRGTKLAKVPIRMSENNKGNQSYQLPEIL
jgi:hypothetical protein